MATTYRYLFVDLSSNTIIGELPLTGVGFTQQLNQPGSFQGHLLLSGVNADKYNVELATIPARCGMYVDRDGILVWGGVVWGRSYNSTTQTLTFNAQEWISYFDHRRVTQDVQFTNVDQLLIAKTLIENAQNATYGDIGVGYNSAGQTTSGILVDRIYYNYELKNVFQAIQDLSRQSDGFDFAIDVDYDINGQPEKYFNTYYPRSGLAYSFGDPNVPVFTFPAGNMVEYEYPEDGSIVANTVYALGAGSNEGKLIAIAQDITKLSTGWALLETTANYSDITDQTVLDNLAIAQSVATSYPPTVLKVVVPAYVDPVFGSYEVGDDARIIITDSRFPNTLDEIYRIVGLSVQPGENGPERVTLTLAQGAGEA
jgi:hypothetical protein